MNIKKQISKYNFSSRNGNGVKYIVIHDTGVNGQTAKNNADFFGGGDRQSSAHYFVDESNIWQVVENGNASWHCGDGNGKYGITNQNSIGIEMCPKDSKIPTKTQDLTIELIKSLQKTYNIPDDRVVRHYDASRKNCPQFLNNDKNWTDWNNFKKKLKGGTTVAEYWNKTGAYELLKDDCFYCEPAFKNKSTWKMKKGSVICVDEIVKYGSVNRGAVMLGKTKRYITLNKSLIKKL